MNAQNIESTRNKVINLIRNRKLSLSQIKDQYRREYSVNFPFSELGNEHIYEIIKNIKGIGFETINGEKFFSFGQGRTIFLEELPKSVEKRKANSPLSSKAATPTKRTRSAPGDDQENVVNSTPQYKSSLRSKSLHRHALNEVTNGIKNTVRFEDDQAASSSTQPRSRSAHGGTFEEDKENIPSRRPTQRQSRRGGWNRKTNDQRKEYQQPRAKSENGRRNELSQWHDFTLVGDDYLLGVAMYELKKQTTKDHKGALQCGLCVSGQTITEATKKLQDDKIPKQGRVLVYIGSIDIIKGKELIELIVDFDKLIKVCETKELQAVYCTLAPISYNRNTGNRNNTLLGFNKYIMLKANNKVIDVHSEFMKNPDDAKQFDKRFTTEPRNISGYNQVVSLWTNYARVKFREIVDKNLGFALIGFKA